MIPLLTPPWLKKYRDLGKGVEKFVAYQRDLMPAERLEEVKEMQSAFGAALKARDRAALGELEPKLVKCCETAVPGYQSSPLRENLEVIIVAVIVALGIRAYYLQPFKIPTASMQPTLNGITAQRMEDEKAVPNVAVKGWEYVWRGRNYVDKKIPAEWGEAEFLGYRQRSKANFFTFTDLYFDKGQITVYAPARQLLGELCMEATVRAQSVNIRADDSPGSQMETLRGGFDATGQPRRVRFKGGEVFARGYVDSGDQLLVDKMSYHFRKPSRGEVFVFSTAGITGIVPPPGTKSQHYIKRLVGVPGDRLQVRPPELLVNGVPAVEEGMKNVAGQGPSVTGFPYQGYRTPSPPQPPLVENYVGFLSVEQTDEVTLPAEPGKRGYMAMGDNSPNSFDSRNWGPVPERNLVGPAFVVYWPFRPHWGLIR